MIKETRRAFTLVEIMIVVAVIAIVLSIAIPNYFHASAISKRTVCINNLRQINSAVERYVMDNNVSNGIRLDASQEDDIYTNYLKGGKPVCPADGEYTIESVGSNPQVVCSKADQGHVLGGEE